VARDLLNAVMRDDAEQDGLPLMLRKSRVPAVRKTRRELDSYAQRLREAHVQTGAGYLAPAADRIAGQPRRYLAKRLRRSRVFASTAIAGYENLGMVIDGAVTRLDSADVLLTAERNDEAYQLACAAREPLERAQFHRELDRLQRYPKDESRRSPITTPTALVGRGRSTSVWSTRRSLRRSAWAHGSVRPSNWLCRSPRPPPQNTGRRSP
jgi:hypothetical protein